MMLRHVGLLPFAMHMSQIRLISSYTEAEEVNQPLLFWISFMIEGIFVLSLWLIHNMFMLIASLDSGALLKERVGQNSTLGKLDWISRFNYAL